MSFKREKEAILDVTTGGGCYYLTVRLLVHPVSTRLVYLASKLKIHPNYVSLICTVFSILCLYYFYTGKFLSSFVFFYIRMVLDYADGALARYASKMSKGGSILDRVIDEIFYLILWIFIALKLRSLMLGIYFLLSVLSYRLIVDLFVYPRLNSLVRRAPLKQFFINHGIILGFGVFAILEFWVLFIFFLGIPRYYIVLPVFLNNLDLVYRTYEVIKFRK